MTQRPRGEDFATPFARDRLTLLAYAMAIASGFAVAALGPAMPSLRDDLGISRAIGGLHFTAIAVGAVLVGFSVQSVTRARGRRWVFWVGGAGVAAGAAVIGLTWHPAGTLLGAVLIGITGTAMLSTSQATLSDHHPSSRAVVLTEVHTATSTGSVLPALLIGVLVFLGAGWRPAFLAPAVIVLALALAWRSVPFPPAQLEPEAGRRHRELPRSYWFFWAAFMPSVGAEWSVAAWGAGYLVDIAGATEAAASIFMTAFFGAIAIGRFVGSRIARSVAPFPLLIGSAALALVGFLVLWGSESVAPIVASLFITGLGISVGFPLLLTLGMNTVPDRPDEASALVFISAGGSVAVAPFALGALADQIGIRAAFGVVPALFVVMVILATAGYRLSTRSDTIGSSTPNP